ncbi:MAG: hypothetical protein LBC53_10350 [Spirochaetaceae bacterium]|nr:hypothetical protein [Spirochaetaceae bacterium]
MASRALKSRRGRIITVLLTPMMSCGAKLPIHLMIAAAVFLTARVVKTGVSKSPGCCGGPGKIAALRTK